MHLLNSVQEGKYSRERTNVKSLRCLVLERPGGLQQHASTGAAQSARTVWSHQLK